MFILLHDPMFTHGGKVKGALMARHSIALTVDGGVIVLDRDDVLAALPALTAFAESPDPEAGDGTEPTPAPGLGRAALLAMLPTLTPPAERPAQEGDDECK